MNDPRSRLVRLTACAVALTLTLCASQRALAQLVPERLYYAKGGSIPMNVHVPEAVPTGERAAPGAQPAEPVIELLEPVTAKVLHSSSVEAGRVDLAGLFPALWTEATPRVYYAQLRVGAAKVGPAVVLQPLVSPARASVDDREPRLPMIVWLPARQPKKVHSGLRAYVDQDVMVDTELGQIMMRLRPDAAPNTAWTVRELVAGGFYDGVVFHRAIATGPVKGEPFVVQAGDPSGTGEGGPGFEVALESSPIKHDYGVVSLARQAREANSGGSQFFICLSRDECTRLDGQYAAFAEVTSGMNVVLKIARAPIASGSSDRPAKPVKIVKATLVDAAPYGEGPSREAMPGGEGR